MATFSELWGDLGQERWSLKTTRKNNGCNVWRTISWENLSATVQTLLEFDAHLFVSHRGVLQCIPAAPMKETGGVGPGCLCDFRGSESARTGTTTGKRCEVGGQRGFLNLEQHDYFERICSQRIIKTDSKKISAKVLRSQLLGISRSISEFSKSSATSSEHPFAFPRSSHCLVFPDQRTIECCYPGSIATRHWDSMTQTKENLPYPTS